MTSFFKAVAGLAPPIRRLQEARDALLAERDELSAALDRRAAELQASRDETARTKRRLDDAHAALPGHPRSPFHVYNSSFDAEDVVLRHAVAGLTPRASYVTNYLGVLVDPKFFPGLIDHLAGTVESPPIPCNWHADLAEWAAALRAVDGAVKRAQERFTIIELGCGWGCWMSITGVAARRLGLDVRLIGIEGDAGHLAFAREAFEVNGFAPSQVSLHHGIAAGGHGTALFPKQDHAGRTWGLEPLFGVSDAQRDAAVASGTFDALKMMTLADLAEGHARIDLLHVDIQGGEADFVSASLDVLTKKVAYLLIGTHSRQIEGRLLEIMLGAGWYLEIERPALLDLTTASPIVTVDGVQAWRNPAYG
jgi:hypothetical protein